ncbi:hypothetical protein GTP46_11270 [Duganella sp. FT135W]|uniref:Uncharacterized protein n=1 Tax=Duganella flavida TaxID=2692175 RepID=A0A6L8K773_9BURK|nr:hypothetical protein [Duganella flavida]MYM23226.1 hypothetical protein [Duganella flavida]
MEAIERKHLAETLFAKVGEARWFAILAYMAESFRAAGALVVRYGELPLDTGATVGGALGVYKSIGKK